MEFPLTLITTLRQANAMAALTGAGISSESGVPTFRDAQTGLWARYDPHELATPEAFRRNPKLVWEWYTWRRELVAQAKPNPGHAALVEIENRISHFTLITQNVDGLHHQAGSRNIVELHGNLHRAKCFQEERVVDRAAWAAASEVPPRCPRCDGPLRPDVVWFGEALPLEALSAASEAAHKCDVFFSIGTSALVNPAASLPYLALAGGAVIVEINLAETPLSREVPAERLYILRGKSGELLPALVNAVWGA